MQRRCETPAPGSPTHSQVLRRSPQATSTEHAINTSYLLVSENVEAIRPSTVVKDVESDVF